MGSRRSKTNRKQEREHARLFEEEHKQRTAALRRAAVALAKPAPTPADMPKRRRNDETTT